MTLPDTQQNALPEFITIKDAVRHFGLSKTTIRRLMDRGAIRSKLVRGRGNVSGKRLLLTETVRDAIMNSPEVGPMPEGN